MLTVGRAKTIMPARNERLDRRRRRPRKRVHLRNLNNLNTSDLQGRVLAGDVAQTIREPTFVLHQRAQRLGFLLTLRPFEHEHMVNLAAGTIDTRNRRDRVTWPDRADVWAILDVEVSNEPCVQAGYAVPHEGVKIGSHGMEGAVSSRRLHRPPHIPRGRIDSLVLKPNKGQRFMVIAPR